MMKPASKPEQFTVTENTALGAFLAGMYKQASGSRIKKMIIRGSIRVNNELVQNPSYRLQPGDRVSYQKPSVLPGDGVRFRILYEDQSIILIDKPAGLLTYGEKGSSGTSVYRELKDYCSKQSKDQTGIFVVHRLDREVSGLLLFARSEKAQETLKSNWQDFTKKYYALLRGVPVEKEGIIQSWLKDGKDLKVRSGKEREGAKLAVTKYKVLKVVQGNALVEVSLVTGRKNQIRVHMADKGHPVIGDSKYGRDANFIRKIRLHSYYLRIRHPDQGNWLEWSVPLPKGFLTIARGSGYDRY